MQRRSFLSLSLVLAGCGGGGGESPLSTPPTAVVPGPIEPSPILPSPVIPIAPSRLAKGAILGTADYETALVEFGGEVLAITFLREWVAPGGTAIRVRRLATGEVLAEKPWSGGMGCAIVKDGVIHIFGSSAWQPGNKVIHSTLGPDFTPSAPTDALLGNSPANPFLIWNMSVSDGPNGFRMVVETTVGVYFARSADMNSWTWDGGQLMPTEYCACPSIHYLNGVHYLTWLASQNGGHVTKTAKSTDDCFTFTYGKTLLEPTAAEGTNNSDLDMIEFSGKVYGVYLDGDQQTYANLRTFTYDGTLPQLFAEYV